MLVYLMLVYLMLVNEGGGLYAELSIERLVVQIAARAEIWLEVSAPLSSSAIMHFDSVLLVGR